jgi:putative transcriptional regulator
MAKAEIRNNLRRLRFEHDEMTQQELADRTQCTRQTILALEQGKYVPSLALAFRIARAFGLKIEAVFEYQGL